MKRIPALVAILYLVLSIVLWIVDDRASHGGWISLRGVVPFLLTIPISGPLAMFGHEPDMTNPLIVVVLMLICAALLYKLTAAIIRFFTSR
ncbi:MAG: hypothetical protein HYX27_26690 [Acidobacteria bacterium]|nr:hypothetical protein [Acidobacteriota bacterium]